MVDYDVAVAAVQDPHADPILLAKIAYENPEFGANVAVNPRCYPGLKRWLAEFGDARARETLAQIGFTADAIGGPIHDQQASANVQFVQTAQPAQTAQPTSTVQTQPTAEVLQNTAIASEEHMTAAAAQATQQTDQATQAAPQTSQQATQQATPQFEEPIPTNPYGFTVEQALHTTDQMQIAQIAQYAPELRVCIARNPNTYPALVDWLHQLGDPAIEAALATRQ
ncbi:hypothetical protein BISA_0004 [Bifidobacterium saguini DSM 23967]|uniref:Leucine rich repeat variant domain-containing protein n=3 Tax=Bifidobacterium TaxID=1678 RepID=A0A2N5IR46_9BIFI|nr:MULTISPECIES: hypothetical protein [Bifidobacterium]KFI93969.1 hypothetical protein BISA_0004 [Bifidobacterium saguini DSM 23967]PLS24425.1 hypothetical protein Tam1G_1546 [Bifidobacterium imperatoris]QSY58035.1 hypothetical protein BLI708_01510 [Bifidobacterium imperatoris]QTB90285.1 hypothetical protein BSD967_08065 [Bifidobacterium saguini]